MKLELSHAARHLNWQISSKSPARCRPSGGAPAAAPPRRRATNAYAASAFTNL
jgi:hypothetical protein